MNPLAALVVAIVACMSARASVVRVDGRVVERESGEPIPAAEVEVVGRQRRTQADATGRFSVELREPSWITLRVSRIGYTGRDTTLFVVADTTVVIELPRDPVAVSSLTARGLRARGARLGRQLFETEVQPGLVGISRAEIADMPAMGEVDVLRALQALPGVIAVNDLAATLHVMGGGPDQNVFLWDGARVYAPYHMFGLLSAFPAAAVDGVEFYRGSVPARYGNGLSSVVDIRQGGRGNGLFGDASLGVVAAGVTAGGPLPAGTGRWTLGGRRTHVTEGLSWLMGRDFPYDFHDAHGHVSWSPTGAHAITGSFLISADRFNSLAFFDLRSAWANEVASVSWTWAGQDGWSSRLHGAWSEYRGDLDLGHRGARHITKSELMIGNAQFELQRELSRSSIRAGVGLEKGMVDLTGSTEPGGYVEGSRHTNLRNVSGFAEADVEVGFLRLAPGFRADFDAERGNWYLQPRASIRVNVTDATSFTLGGGRTVQWLTTVHDARNVLPGAPLWIGPEAANPASEAVGIGGSFTHWVDQEWNLDVSGYLRSFEAVPTWFPEGSRTLASLRFDDGRAQGIELMVRRQGPRISGWVAYGLARVEHVDGITSRAYGPAWDRRHSLDAAFFGRIWSRAKASLRLSYATGTPFWPFMGHQLAPRLNATSRKVQWDSRQRVPYWARDQMRMPQHFRLDASVEGTFRALGGVWEPFVSVINLTARPNVLYYQAEPPRAQSSSEQTSGANLRTILVPVTASPINLIPSFGLRVSF